MDVETITILMRMGERMVAVAIGGVAIYCGYKLFALLPVTQHDSTGQLEVPGAKIVLARVSPGLLFAALGVSIVLYALNSRIEMPLPLSSKGRAERQEDARFVGMVPAAAAGDEMAVPGQIISDVDLETLVSQLNCLRQVSSFPAAPYPKGAAVVDEAVVLLLRSAWRPTWGDPTALLRWQKDADTELPAELKATLLNIEHTCPESPP